MDLWDPISLVLGARFASLKTLAYQKILFSAALVLLIAECTFLLVKFHSIHWQPY